MAVRFTTLAVKSAALGGAALALAACGSTQGAKKAETGQDAYREALQAYSDPAVEAGMDPIAAAAFWGTRYNTDQSDPAVAVKFSSALRKIGSVNEAAEVMNKTATQFPDNNDVNLEYGKVLIESGRAFEAVRYLEAASAAASADWRAVSAYGVALDQIGEHEEARKKYDRALTMAPRSVNVVNNKGLSYALDGDLNRAKQTLRTAAGMPGADARVRQNLALVLALAGDMREAERLARADLPPLAADNNVDFFRQLMSQPAYWDEYAASTVDAPSFDDAPIAPPPGRNEPAAPLKVEPKQPDEKKTDDKAPIALMEVAPVINASQPVAAEDDDE